MTEKTLEQLNIVDEGDPPQSMPPDKEPGDERSSEALAAIIVAHRALGAFKEESRSAMIELMKRKKAGDDFDFDGYITKRLGEVPKSKFSPEIARFMNNLSRMGGVGK